MPLPGEDSSDFNFLLFRCIVQHANPPRPPAKCAWLSPVISKLGADLMEKYKNLSGSSGVTYFENARDAITVQFEDGWKYLYTAQSAGAQNVKQMHRLASAGQGLGTFISQTVRQNYVRKWR